MTERELTEEQKEMLVRLAAGAHAAGNASVAANPSDPAHWMLLDGHTSTPTVRRDGCYICKDPEFAQMGLPLCYFCPACKTGHVPADEPVCDDCGHEVGPWDYPSGSSQDE